MSKKSPKDRVSNEALVETGTIEARESGLLSVSVGDWSVLFEWSGKGRVVRSTEDCEGFALVHFDLPDGPLGEYRVSVQQPLIDRHRSWVGSMDCWRGTELVSLALNYSFDTAANRHLPVVCNYARLGTG